MVGVYLCGKFTPNDDVFFPCIASGIVDAIGKENIVFIEPYVKPRFVKTFKSGREMKVIGFTPGKCKNWTEVREYAKDLLVKNEIETLIVFKTIMSAQFKVGNMGLIKGLYEDAKRNDQFGFSFNQTRHILEKYVLVEQAADVCKNVYQFVSDPQEADFSEVIKFQNFKRLHILQDSGKFVYMPCYEYKLQKYCGRYAHNMQQKQFDFVFMCSAVTEDRNFIVKQKEVLTGVKNSVVRIIERKQKYLAQHEYYDLLSRSKFTLCIKPYDNTSFSIARFLEALMVDCLALVSSDCCLDRVKETFLDIYEIMVTEGLIVNYSDVQSTIYGLNNNINNIINKLKDTKSFRRMTNEKFIKERWSKLL